MPLSLLPFGAVLPATVYSLLSLWCGWRFFRGQASECRGQDVAISILKPVKGLEEDSYENFASFCRQQYDAPVQVIFAVTSASDPVIPIIRQLMADFPNLDISLQINATIPWAQQQGSPT